jgi:lysozyme family protein
MGINATSLGNYNKTHPNFNFPDNIKEVLPEQARQIYQEDYYGRRGIKDIENDRVAFAIMDMGVMSGFNEVVKTVQKTINQTLSDKVSVNGTYNEKIRRETLDALNNIPEDGVDAFMKKLIENRLDYLEKLDPDFLQNPGWRNRTRKYIESRQ